MTKDEQKQKNKLYYEANKLKRKLEYEANKDKVKEYRETNKEKISEQRKEYYKFNKEKIKAKYELNKDKLIPNERTKQKQREYKKNKKITNPLFKLSENIRNSIRTSFNNSRFKKLTKTQIILGCSFDELKQHLESKFEDWMNWENYGTPKNGIYEFNKTWDIDHIKPTSTAKNETELIALNHYTNLQPLCSKVNRFIKRNNIN